MECEYCGNNHKGVYGSGRFCNKKCARGFSTKEKREEINKKVSRALKKNNEVILKCKRCKKEFEVKYNKRFQKFCSRKCSYKGDNRTDKEIYSKVIFKNIKKEKNCWIWQKSCSSAGYGQFTEKGVYWNTHRFVWYYHNGEIPKGKVIRHSCHNKKCCNPEHLLLGTQKENYEDSKKVYRKAQKKRRKKWVIKNKKFDTIAEASKYTGISLTTIIKHTDKKTRVFDFERYKENCFKAGWKPKNTKTWK